MSRDPFLLDFPAWTALAGDSDVSRTEWAAVLASWSEPHRRYHGLTHLAAVLGLVGRLAGAAPDPDAVGLAAWYHDVVYDPRRTDNERRSAERARAGLRGLVPEERLAEVERLVLLTVGHEPEPGDGDGAVLCDADLAVLAAPPESYATYASAVREEYRHLADDAFTAGRIAVLEQLLSRPTLYHLPAVAEEWTPRARANLGAELALLRQRAAGASGDEVRPPSAG
jgi:predicted metal-dependent HD superfamily phosphohydrolase